MFGIIITLKFSIKEESQHFKNILVGIIVTLCVIYQYWELSNAAVTLPFKFKEDMYRWECLHSIKGGKRPYGDTTKEIYKNPCFYVDRNVNCSKNNESIIDLDNSLNNNTTCDINNYVSSSELFIDDKRDCEYSKKASCTKNAPCVPCELKHRHDFGNRWKRCKSCVNFEEKQNKKKSCNFIKGIGPYCYKSATSRDVMPCVKCCTEPYPDLSTDGKCY